MLAAAPPFADPRDVWGPTDPPGAAARAELVRQRTSSSYQSAAACPPPFHSSEPARTHADRDRRPRVVGQDDRLQHPYARPRGDGRVWGYATQRGRSESARRAPHAPRRDLPPQEDRSRRRHLRGSFPPPPLPPRPPPPAGGGPRP